MSLDGRLDLSMKLMKDLSSRYAICDSSALCIRNCWKNRAADGYKIFFCIVKALLLLIIHMNLLIPRNGKIQFCNLLESSHTLNPHVYWMRLWRWYWSINISIWIDILPYTSFSSKVLHLIIPIPPITWFRQSDWDLCGFGYGGGSHAELSSHQGKNFMIYKLRGSQ